MGLREDIQPYTLPDGRIRHTLNQETGNGLRELCIYRALMELLSQWTDSDHEAFNATVVSCWVAPGHYRRSANNLEQEAIDDYIPLSASDTHVAFMMNFHGLTYPEKVGPFTFHHFYNTVCPRSLFEPLSDPSKRKAWEKAANWLVTAPQGMTINWGAWFGRYPLFPTHLIYAMQCAGEPKDLKPTWLQQLIWAAGVASTGLFNSTAQDPWVLTWFMVRAVKEPTWLTKWATQVYFTRLYKCWPGTDQFPPGLGHVLGRYYGFPHPLAVHFKVPK